MKTQLLNNTGLDLKEAYNETCKLLSELWLYKDEYRIFEDMIANVKNWNFENNTNGDRTELLDAIYKSEKRNFMLLDMVNTYAKKLKHLLNAKTGRFSNNEHIAVTSTLNHHRKQYQRLKKQVLQTLKWLKKEEKTRRLHNRKEGLLFS